MDVDPAHGGRDSLAAIETQDDDLPVTMEQITGGDGQHVLFNHPGPEFRNTAGKLGAGLDTRGEGGYIIVPPSNHKSGNSYRWKEGQKPGQVELADVPAWLLDRLRKKEPKAPSQPPSGNGEATAYAEAALAGEQQAVAKAQPSTRNHQLNSSAFALGQFVGAGLLDQGRVEWALTDAAMAAGLDDIEISRTIKSGIEAGLAEPREVPDQEKIGGRRSDPVKGNGHAEPQSSPHWAEPVPLPSALPDVPEMPDSLLPPVLKPWLCDICERTQIPLDYTAAPAIVALSSLIGRTVGLYPKQQDDWLVVSNLWGVVVGRPGVLKSPAMVEALKPLQRLAHAAGEEHKQAARAAEAKSTVIQAKLDAATVQRDRRLAAPWGLRTEDCAQGSRNRRGVRLVAVSRLVIGLAPLERLHRHRDNCLSNGDTKVE